MKADTSKKTPHPGIRRDGNNRFVVRVAMRDKVTGRHHEKERIIEGTLADAIKEREHLRAELKQEAEGKHVVQRAPKTETLIDFAARWLVHLKKTGRTRDHVLANHIGILDRFI